MKRTDIRISVLGDVAWQEVLVPDGSNPSQYRRHTAWIGAPLLLRMVDAALGKVGSIDRSPVSFAPDYAGLTRASLDGAEERAAVYEKWDALLDACGQYSATLASFPRESRSDDKKDTVLRVARDLRATQADPPRDAGGIARLLGEWALEAVAGEAGHRVVIVYDRGLFLRDNVSALEAVLRQLTAKDAVVVAIEGELHAKASASPTEAGVDERLARLLGFIPPLVRHRAIIVLTADGLRRSGVPIVEYGHVEQAVRDVVGQLDGPVLGALSEHCRHIVVSTQESALVHVVVPEKPGEPGRIGGSIHICPNWDKLAQADSARYGSSPGKLWMVVTAIGRQLCQDLRAETPDVEVDPRPWDLAPALRLATLAFNSHAKRGLARAAPFDTIVNALADDACKQMRDEIASRRREFLISSLTFDLPNMRAADSWSRIDALVQSNKTAEEALYRIVEDGVEAAFREKRKSPTAEPQGTRDSPWFPGYAIDCPYAEFGSVKLVDEREIANYVSLSKLIEKYFREQSWSKPLSIAVFGAPGSGKSYAVKEIIKTVSPQKPEGEPPTFNLAQFSSVDNLTDAFHLVQDRVLASTAVPLIIFDEFDCSFDGSPLGWLKYFLAPMQDGLFHGNNQDYRIGRAIFLFSGGTAETYEKFRNQLNRAQEKAIRRQVKLSDFVSRLRGHLDVLGLNDRKPAPRVLAIRRAILLRSILERLAEPIFSPQNGVDKRAAIQRQVIDKFVHEWDFVHGVRSLEAVVQTSRWIDGSFVLSSLPHKDQLESHVGDAAGRRAR